MLTEPTERQLGVHPESVLVEQSASHDQQRVFWSVSWRTRMPLTAGLMAPQLAAIAPNTRS